MVMYGSTTSLVPFIMLVLLGGVPVQLKSLSGTTGKLGTYTPLDLPMKCVCNSDVVGSTRETLLMDVVNLWHWGLDMSHSQQTGACQAPL
jgi:hypothetical protein